MQKAVLMDSNHQDGISSYIRLKSACHPLCAGCTGATLYGHGYIWSAIGFDAWENGPHIHRPNVQWTMKILFSIVVVKVQMADHRPQNANPVVDIEVLARNRIGMSHIQTELNPGIV